MTETFRPEIWSHAILENMRYSMVVSSLISGPEERRRKWHTVVTPYTAEQIQGREDAITKWQTLTDELAALGYLEHDYCGECGGELVPVTETEVRDYVYDETEEEHQARVALLPPLPKYVHVTQGFNKISLDTIKGATS